MRSLLKILGHPEEGLNFIHLAGTNGKGSTAAALQAILQTAGFFPGLYTSPHLLDFRERFRVGGKMVTEKVLQRHLGVLLRAVARIPQSSRPTFFEAATVLALKIFREARVDLVIWETGLGGRLDATNVVTPEVCVLTSLGKDHQAILGEGWAQIGREKAGIVKKGIPVFSAPWPAAARRVLARRTQQLRSPWRVIPELPRRNHALPLAGRHQRQNFALAQAVARYLGIPEKWIGKGLGQTIWPGRFTIFRSQPPWVLDGAHNLEGIQAALQTWGEKFGAPPARVILGCLQDKPREAMLRALAKTGAEIWGVELGDSRGASPLLWKNQPWRIYATVAEALVADAAQPVSGGTLVLGSLVLVGEVFRARGVKVA